MEISREAGVDLPQTRKRAAGDPKSLRGVPVTGVPGGMGGTMSDTQPERALIRRETQAERRNDR
jgi:hypothetical protein